MTPVQFIARLLPAATACAKRTGIPASFTIAQAAFESAWGASQLSRSGFNLFGVKADASWHGPVTVLQTKEHINGKDVMVRANWRCYQNWFECIDDRAKFFKDNPRYNKCFVEKTGEGWAHAVAAAGYATDPNYAANLIAVIRGRNLSQYDQP